MGALFGTMMGAAPAASAAPVDFGYGAVSVKGPSSELVVGAEVSIFEGTCEGPEVWFQVTTDQPDAYGAFGIGLPVGTYCLRASGAALPYGQSADVTFTIEPRSGNWVTAWLPIGSIDGAVVAKDSQGARIDGVTALTQLGSCSAPGQSVWQNTTQTNRWASGNYGVAFGLGTICTTVLSVPAGYTAPPPVESVVTSPGPIWITLWLAGSSR